MKKYIAIFAAGAGVTILLVDMLGQPLWLGLTASGLTGVLAGIFFAEQKEHNG